MLSPVSIARFVVAGRTGHLLEALIANGQYLPGELKCWLMEIGPTPALALGLRRVLELSRRPTPASELLIQALLDAQSPDGFFENDPLATALAASALLNLRQDHHVDEPRVREAHEHALSALEHMLGADGLFYDAAALPSSSRQLFTAWILQLLARDPQARGRLGLENLLIRLECHQNTMSRDTQSFLRIARASLPRAIVAA